MSTNTQTARDADRLRQNRRADGGIDPAREAAHHPVDWPDAPPDLADRPLDECPHRPGLRVRADPIEEVPEDQRAIRRVRDFGMKLQAEDRSAGDAARPRSGKSGSPPAE